MLASVFEVQKKQLDQAAKLFSFSNVEFFGSQF